jgi:hypothetical protein
MFNQGIPIRHARNEIRDPAGVWRRLICIGGMDPLRR